MMKMKKIKCKVCDCEFIPQVKGHYIARTDGKTGVVAAFQSNDETGLFDAFDTYRFLNVIEDFVDDFDDDDETIADKREQYTDSLDYKNGMYVYADHSALLRRLANALKNF